METWPAVVNEEAEISDMGLGPWGFRLSLLVKINNRPIVAFIDTRTQRLAEGDKNTGCFHRRASQRKDKRFIRSLVDDQCRVCGNQKDLDAPLLNYSSHLFSSSSPSHLWRRRSMQRNETWAICFQKLSWRKRSSSMAFTKCILLVIMF